MLPGRSVPSEPRAAPFAGRLDTDGFLLLFGVLSPPLLPSRKYDPGKEKPVGCWAATARRDAASPHGVLSGAGLRTRPRLPRRIVRRRPPRYETEMRRRFRGGGGGGGRTVSADGLPAVTGVVSGVMSGSRFLPARCIGRRLLATRRTKSQASFIARFEKLSSSPRSCLGQAPAPSPLVLLGR